MKPFKADKYGRDLRYDDNRDKTLVGDIPTVGGYKWTPSKVYIRKDGVKLAQYVTYAKYPKIKAVWDSFVNLNKKEPNYVYINDKFQLHILTESWLRI